MDTFNNMKDEKKNEVEKLVYDVDDFLFNLYKLAPFTVINAIIMARLVMHSKSAGEGEELKKFLEHVISGEFEKKGTLQ